MADGKWTMTDEDAKRINRNENNYFQGKVNVGVILTMNAGK